MYFDIFKSDKPIAQKYWWVAKGGNGEVLCTSEMLASKQSAIDTITMIRSDAVGSAIYDETGERPGYTAAERRIR